MKKVISVSTAILMAIMCLFLTSCGKQQPIPADVFKTKMEAQGLRITERVGASFESSLPDSDVSALIALSNNGWRIEHYTCKTSDDAKILFESCKESIDKQGTNSGSGISVSHKETSFSNSKKYTLIKTYDSESVPGVYSYVQMIDNYIIYFCVNGDQYEDGVTNALDALGLKM